MGGKRERCVRIVRAARGPTLTRNLGRLELVALRKATARSSQAILLDVESFEEGWRGNGSMVAGEAWTGAGLQLYEVNE
jgi:hypothetical protein